MSDDFDDLLKDLDTLRDEIQLQLHLASLEAKEEWGGLEQQWDDFSARAKLAQSGEDIGGALDLLGGELKQAYTRFKNAL